LGSLRLGFFLLWLALDEEGLHALGQSQLPGCHVDFQVVDALRQDLDVLGQRVVGLLDGEPRHLGLQRTTRCLLC
jgi:hypothetical protein